MNMNGTVNMNMQMRSGDGLAAVFFFFKKICQKKTAVTLQPRFFEIILAHLQTCWEESSTAVC